MELSASMELAGEEELSQKVSRCLALSEYEASVYVSLVVEGASEAGKLSVRCGVPRTKVYAVLGTLVERGLVLEIPAEPRRFAAAISPAKAFERYLFHLREKTSEKVASLEESHEVVSLLEEAYMKTLSTSEPWKEEVWIVQGESEILSKAKEMLSHAKKSVYVVTMESGFVWFYKAFDKLLDRLAEKGVNVQIRTPINSHNGSLTRELNYVCKVKHANVDSPSLCVFADDQAFLLAKLNLNKDNMDSEKSLAFACYSSTLCDLLSLFFPSRSFPELGKQQAHDQ